MWQIFTFYIGFRLFNYTYFALASDNQSIKAGNYGIQVIDLPTARSFPDEELVITHQNNKNMFMTGISFPALPKLGISFRYGDKVAAEAAQGRVNWDRSFDAHISVLDERPYLPAISLGLRDFIARVGTRQNISSVQINRKC